MTDIDKLLEFLERNGIPFKYEGHEPVLNMRESDALHLSLPGVRCKNLLVQDKQGRNYLIVTTANKALDLASVAKTFGSKRLSFASVDRLFELLGVRPGSLSPLALVNDRSGQISLVIDHDLMHEPMFQFHPLENTATIALSKRGLEEFLQRIDHPPSWKNLEARLSS
ncbi:prolyl-tRNA synthetase associated domain-containing protein [Caballeronia sp. LjRoot34]|uniref:prolyl-tRNA synthetase associated domain-containing protein n=1 Tax=Caballeronia sp. LjRoot34 TaxID=3342325 RepID=UPI003ED06089